MHSATPDFWFHYRNLPDDTRAIADKAYRLLQDNPRHPSLHFKKIGALWSVRVNLGYRALAVETADGYAWFWIGTHAEYDRLLS